MELYSQPRFLSAARAMVGQLAQRLGFNEIQCGQLSLVLDDALLLHDVEGPQHRIMLQGGGDDMVARAADSLDQQVQRIHVERPIEAPPLPVESCTVGMLLLHHTDDLYAPGFHVRRHGLLPPGQDASAARSPGREVQDQRLAAQELRVPALRERAEDVGILTLRALRQYEAETQKSLLPEPENRDG